MIPHESFLTISILSWDARSTGLASRGHVRESVSIFREMRDAPGRNIGRDAERARAGGRAQFLIGEDRFPCVRGGVAPHVSVARASRQANIPAHYGTECTHDIIFSNLNY